MPVRTSLTAALLGALCLTVGACPASKNSGDGTDAAVAAEKDSGTSERDAGGRAPKDAGCTQEKSVVDKVDLLLMVDNSNSMAGEQRSLQAAFPSFLNDLTSDAPISSLHVGVVTSDMGIPGVEWASGNCHADGGDDGRMQHTPHGQECDAMYPSFLTYIGDPKVGQTTDAEKFAKDMACISNLGTGGCGFEQQLEAPFKALWPKLQVDTRGNVISPNRFRFLGITEEGTWGRGDQPASEGGNAGFLRNDASQGQSLIAIVVITDEEDCSVRDTAHLKPTNQLSEDSPYRVQDPNLRCYYNKQFLYDIKDRYYNGYRMLREGHEDLVVFAALTGVPADLVDDDALAKVDFTSTDRAGRSAFYDGILNDPRMLENIDPSTNPGSGQGNLKPSCVRQTAAEAVATKAFPPRRILELAKLFDRNAMVQSICQDDFAPALRRIAKTITRARQSTRSASCSAK